MGSATIASERESVAGFRQAHVNDPPPAVDRTLAPRGRFASFAELDWALADVAESNHLDVPAPLTPTRRELEAALDAATWNRRGNAFRTLGQDEDSLHCMRRALELEPDEIGAYNNVGAALERLGHEKEGLEYREKEVAAHPDVPRLRVILGEAYAMRGRYAEAAKAYRIGPIPPFMLQEIMPGQGLDAAQIWSSLPELPRALSEWGFDGDVAIEGEVDEPGVISTIFIALSFHAVRYWPKRAFDRLGDQGGIMWPAGQRAGLMGALVVAVAGTAMPPSV